MSTVTVNPEGGIQINGRHLLVGSIVSVYGERGRFRYTGFTHSGDGKLILCFVGGKSGHEMMRSFYPEKVRTVHNSRQSR
jgi:hypothetical protein